MYAEQLKKWLNENAVSFCHDEYRGIHDLDLEQLGALQILVEATIREKLNSIGPDNKE